jgi:hypothetical protein
MTWIDDREFEPVVREAMRARPEAGSISNLAYRAIERAREQARAMARRQLEGLMQLRRRRQWIGAVAAALIAVVVMVGAKRLSDSGAWGTTTGVSVSNFNSSGNASDSTSSSSDMLTPSDGLMAELLVVGLILLSAGVALSRSEGNESVYC